MKRSLLLLIIACTLVPVKAQTLNEAKKYYEAGDYIKAENAFSKLAKRRVMDAFGYLADIYNRQYKFEEAEKNIDEYISQLKRKRSSTEQAEELAAQIRRNARMIQGVEDVMIIDSIVVNKENFLSYYKISPESGSLDTYNHYFNSSIEPEATVYMTELENRLYYAKTSEDSLLTIYTRIKELNDWGEEKMLPESMDGDGNTNYPYVMPDGVTIYYASDGEGSIGGYDIFVTRYNSYTDTYLAPENVGMPFNSPANDYMLVIDEFNNLGWFASDRNQPEDSVCIYVFIPNRSKLTYNNEVYGAETIRKFAQIRSIRDTWKNEFEVEDARSRLATAMNYQPVEKKKNDFEFIINDHTVYGKTEDFRSGKARNLYKEYEQQQKNYQELLKRLESQRENYNKASGSEKEKMRPAIVDMEQHIEKMEEQLENQEIEIRNEEI
ncbi:MAG: hypothetical protein LUD15_14540, partial [Bacteroides sp.]|nr:hypothetical protein [Bacteroides sp.]